MEVQVIYRFSHFWQSTIPGEPEASPYHCCVRSIVLDVGNFHSLYPETLVVTGVFLISISIWLDATNAYDI